jgi:hypothetical protein
MGAAVIIGLKSGLSAALLVFLVTGAEAAEMCVKCTGPDASYDCVVNNSGPVDTVTKLYCITALAKEGPHASCSIDRNSTAPCQGARKEFTIPAGMDGGLSGPGQQNADAPVPLSPDATAVAAPAGGPAPGGQPAVGEPPDQGASNTPPKTVQEMIEKSTKSTSDSFAKTQKTAGNAAKSAGTALENAGSAVGNAAKTSWKCLSSFFSNC